MLLKLFIITATLSLTNLHEYNAQTSLAAAAPPQTQRDSLVMSIDSLRWMYYSMNYFKKARHYRYDSLPVVSVLECDADISVSHRIDTVVYYFNLTYGNIKGPYEQDGYPFVGIGYSYKEKNLFPMTDPNIYPTFAQNKDTCEAFFESHERGFVNYLKSEYKGKLSPWLKQEAIRRRIL
jgi:hypothetical protein